MNSVKTSLRRQSCRRMSHEVMPDHVQFKSELKSPSFCDVYRISSNKSASICRSEVMGKLPQILYETAFLFKLIIIDLKGIPLCLICICS
jgi:hypothetical protein